MKIYALIGLIGAILMFFGDMSLYLDFNTKKQKNSINYTISAMRNVSRARLYLGGLIGPTAALLYLVGFHHITLIAGAESAALARISFIFCSLGLIIGGAFHSHCAYLGLIGRLQNSSEALNEVVKYIKIMAIFVYSCLGIGTGLLTLLIGLGKTLLPGWYIVFSPFLLIMLKPLLFHLPNRFEKIINGGWTNLIFVIYYIAVLIYLI